jgi:hypothetical protein
MIFPGVKVTRHVGEWILNIYSPTAKFGRIGEWASAYPQHCDDCQIIRRHVLMVNIASIETVQVTFQTYRKWAVLPIIFFL